MSNGVNGKVPEGGWHGIGGNGDSRALQARVNRLPEEIAHIAENYFPLSMLLARLAQKTHAELLGTLRDLGQMPAPASVLNSTL